MSFKINDYNAFLTSLFDKNPDQETLQSLSYEQRQQLLQAQQIQQAQQNMNFPVNFDFGLVPPKHSHSPHSHYTGNDHHSPHLDSGIIGTESSLLNMSASNSMGMLQHESDGSNPQMYSAIGSGTGDKSTQYTTPLVSPLSIGITEPHNPLYVKQEERNPSLYIKQEEPNKITPLFSTERQINTRNSKKTRVKSEPLLSATEASSSRPRIKSAHNIIEQRYRNKINDKFTTLQNSVPTLRIVSRRKQKRLSDDDYDSDRSDDDCAYTDNDVDVDLEGLEPAKKLNKGTILAKSIEYIKFLELKNDRMKQEHEELMLKARMMGLVVDDSLTNKD